MNWLTSSADQQWLSGPRWLLGRSPGLRGLAGDGHVLVTVPVFAAILPAACLALGLVCGLARLGYEDVYTESIAVLAVIAAIGAFSGQLGVLVVAGLCIGDFGSAWVARAPVTPGSSVWFSGPLGEGLIGRAVHQWLPLLVSYLLLVAGVVLLPRAARAVVSAVGRGRELPPALAWALVSGLYVVIMWLGTDAWVAAAPTLVRPVFTWATPSGAPTVEAMSTLQESGGIVVAAAVVATLARQAWLGLAMLPGGLRDRLEAAERDAPNWGVSAAPLAEPGTARRIGIGVVACALATLAMAGILEQVWLWPVVFAVLFAIRLLRSGEVTFPALVAWQRIASALPAWARLISLWLISRVIVQSLSSTLITSYTGLSIFVLVSIVVVFVVFPGGTP